jgi:hypothetical protein
LLPANAFEVDGTSGKSGIVDGLAGGWACGGRDKSINLII